MALFHVDASVISKGTRRGGAQGFAQYLQGHAGSMEQYLTREGHGRDDLVAHGEGALPTWAKDGAHFFAMAERFERQGGLVARHYQITLPRELSPQGRLDLADDLRAVFFERYPHVYAVHNPHARDGSGDQPHLHMMFSTRREDEPSTRTPKHWFARAAEQGRDPLEGGVRKDRSWDAKRQLFALRAETATLINAALEREGLAVAVSHTSLRARGYEREPSVYTRTADKARVTEEREQLSWANHPYENARNLLVWQEQKAREGLRDLSRDAIRDHCRDRFWQHDHSPARELEREASLLRAIDREYARTGRERGLEPQRVQDRVRTPQRIPVWGDEDRAEGGVHWREAERERVH